MEPQKTARGPSDPDKMISSRSETWTPEVEKFLRRMKRQIEIRRQGHYDLSRKMKYRHYLLGIPATIFASVASTGILATFRNCKDEKGCDSDQWIRLLAGVIGLLDVGITGVMTFVNFKGASENHKTAADNYEKLDGLIDNILVISPANRDDSSQAIQEIRAQYNDIVKEAPNLSKEYQIPLSSPLTQKRVRLPTIDPMDVGFVRRSPQEARKGIELLKNVIQEIETPFRSPREIRKYIEPLTSLEEDDEDTVFSDVIPDQMLVQPNKEVRIEFDVKPKVISSFKKP